MEILGFEISKEVKAPFLKKKCIISTINPHSYYVSKKDACFRTALKKSDYLLPDGIGICFAVRLLLGEKITKIAGNDIHDILLNTAEKESLKVFYLGASMNTLKKIEEKVKVEFPRIKISSYSPPFKEAFSDNDNKEIIDKINTFEPDIIFVGMTAPKQEKWLFQNKDKIHFKVAASIGAVFNFYSGEVNRPPAIILNLGLEWLGRLVSEPRRLWKRNFVSIPVFLIDVFKEKLGVK